MKTKRKIVYLVLLVTLLSACSVYKTLANISYVKFKIKDITNFSVLGINISHKSGLKDLSFGEIAKLTAATTRDELPVVFTIDIEAKNSNKNAYEATDVKISSFPFTLYYNDKELISGNIDNPVSVPGKNQTIVFPVKIGFDVLKVFNNMPLEDIAGLLFDLGGKNKNLDAIKIKATPVLMLPGGFTYKQSVTIDSKMFN